MINVTEFIRQLTEATDRLERLEAHEVLALGGGGGGAPADAQYLTLALDALLTQERVLTEGADIDFVDTGANGTLTVGRGGDTVLLFDAGLTPVAEWAATNAGFAAAIAAAGTNDIIQLPAALTLTAAHVLPADVAFKGPCAITASGDYGSLLTIDDAILENITITYTCTGATGAAVYTSVGKGCRLNRVRATATSTTAATLYGAYFRGVPDGTIITDCYFAATGDCAGATHYGIKVETGAPLDQRLIIFNSVIGYAQNDSSASTITTFGVHIEGTETAAEHFGTLVNGCIGYADTFSSDSNSTGMYVENANVAGSSGICDLAVLAVGLHIKGGRAFGCHGFARPWTGNVAHGIVVDTEGYAYSCEATTVPRSGDTNYGFFCNGTDTYINGGRGIGDTADIRVESGTAHIFAVEHSTTSVAGGATLDYTPVRSSFVVPAGENITMASETWIGIGAADLRTEYDTTASTVTVHLGDAAGVDEWEVRDNAGVQLAKINSLGNTFIFYGLTVAADRHNLVVIQRDGNDAFPPQIVWHKSRGTFAAPAAVTNGTYIGNQMYKGYDGAGFVMGGQLRGLARENWGVGANGASMEFYVTANTTAVQTQAMVIEQNADVSIGVAYGSIAAQLDVDQASATGAQPVLRLDQGDLSEQCIVFRSDGVDRDINLYTVDVIGTPTMMWDESADALDWNKNLVLSVGQQNYMFTNRNYGTGSSLVLRSQLAGQACQFEMYTTDGDGTDSTALTIWGVGTPDAVGDRERIVIQWRVALSQYAIWTEAQGTGTLRELVLFTGGNAGQVLLGTTGNVSFSGNLLISGILSGATQAAAGAAADELWKTNGHAILPDNVVMIGV